MNDNPYTEDYFERGIQTGLSLYENYSWMPQLTIPMAMTMIDYLGIKRGQSILDIGCAKGYLVKAFRWLGRCAWGIDTSDYAVDQADSEVVNFVRQSEVMIDPLAQGFDFAIAKDILEHIPEEGLHDFLDKIMADVLFVIVPLGDRQKYFVPAYELDVTHKIRRPLEWWNQALKATNWSIRSSCYRVEGIKDNWSHVKDGNGFIVCERA